MRFIHERVDRSHRRDVPLQTGGTLMSRKPMFRRAVPRPFRVLAACCLLLVARGAPAGPPGPATDEEVQSLLARATVDAYPNVDVLTVLDESDVYVRPSGLATTEHREIVRLLTTSGARSKAVLRYSIDPDTNRFAIRSVRIHRADGGIEESSLEGIVTQPTRQGSIFWGGTQYLLSLPKLEAGDALEIRTSKIGFNIAYLTDGVPAPALSGDGLTPPMPGHWYESTMFQGGSPIMKKRYAVHMPSNMPLQYEVYNGAVRSSLWSEGDTNIHTFIAEDVPAAPREPHSVAGSDRLTKLVMATVPDWEMKSRWFHEVNEGQFEADDDIRAKVAEITAGMTDREEKIEALLHWVADNIRYYGTSRGPCEGFTLHTGIETFRDRGGVCKDIAGMLITMLRVIGEESYPTLTMAGSRVEAIPADQFNHTVTAIREPDGNIRVLDPTWSPTSKELWSSREALQGIVHGTPEGQTLMLSPYFPPEHNRMIVQSDCTIEEQGACTAWVKMDLAGYPGTSLRRSANRAEPYDQQARFEDQLGISDGMTIDHIDWIRPQDYRTDAWLTMEISDPGYAATGPDRLAFKLPMMQHPFRSMLNSDLGTNVNLDERRYALKLRATRQIVYEETISLPEGYIAIDLPEPESIDEDTAMLDWTIEQDGGALTYRFELQLRDHIVAPEDYEGLKQAFETMRRLADTWIICERQAS
jgi:hypothetical protein